MTQSNRLPAARLLIVGGAKALTRGEFPGPVFEDLIRTYDPS
jgi:hypothetical protein